ncbi:restriction endonuclease [Paenibacillus paridis]|uniref:restriction endonuclease n=1 Tax=Paenibacillus paridis TaxID=2583376 RepID=UPI001391CEDE|nr:restriction endonuclease [Paenibacillus paridis]
MAISINRGKLIVTTSEIIGYKAGLGLTREEFADIMPKEHHRIWFGSDEDGIRIYPEEYEELISDLLNLLGNTESDSPSSSIIFTAVLRHKYGINSIEAELMSDIVPLFYNFLEKADKIFDPTPFINEARIKYGIIGEKVAIDLLKGFNNHMHKSPWTTYREMNWVDTAQLKDLFISERLETHYGTFLDQRYIDYLSVNFDKINNMNWRKFEGLTAEFFERQGYFVEIGAGRGDGGIDIRVWQEDPSLAGPPTILIQCKRYKKTIEQVIVKALYADMVSENVPHGLIVTTSSLSPSAKEVCNARSYPIQEVNKTTLRKWIEVMRKPHSGIFLGK